MRLLFSVENYDSAHIVVVFLRLSRCNQCLSCILALLGAQPFSYFLKESAA